MGICILLGSLHVVNRDSSTSYELWQSSYLGLVELIMS